MASAPTTFGAIVERKPKSNTSSPALSQSNHSSPFNKPLQLSSTATYIEPAFTSPYDMAESSNEHPDLEHGLYTHANVNYEDNQPRMLPIHTPTRSTPSPMLGEIIEEDENEDSISNAPTITNNLPHHTNTLPTIITTSPTTPAVSGLRGTSSSHTPTPSSGSNSNEKTPASSTTRPTLPMWPTQQEVKAKAKADKLARSKCNPLARLSKRTRVIISITIALTIIGAAIGIGVGVSRAYGGSVWAGRGKTRPIGGSSSSSGGSE